MSEPAIAARRLEKRFGHATALTGVDLEVPAGSSLAVLGPNGAGKSTLLRLMAGLGRPSGGSLSICGEAAHDRAARARVGFVGHATFLYAALTARENVLFAARLHRVPDAAARVQERLAQEGLDGAAHLAAGALSRGMAQRLAVARGLVHDPEIVLLDEPFAGLDRRAAQRLAGRLADLRHEGRTAVLATHDVGLAAQVADLAIVLAAGRVAHEVRAPQRDVAALERAYVAASEASP